MGGHDPSALGVDFAVATAASAFVEVDVGDGDVVDTPRGATRSPRTPNRRRRNPPRGLACDANGQTVRPPSARRPHWRSNSRVVRVGRIACGLLDTLAPAFRAARHTGPGNLGERPQGASRVGPDDGGHAAGPSGKPAFGPLAMHTTNRTRHERGKEATMASEPLPVTGAWQPADPTGQPAVLHVRQRPPVRGRERRRAARRHDRLRDLGHAQRRSLERRARLPRLDRRLRTPPGRAGPGHIAPGWWDDVVGPGRHIDTNRWFVVCANVLGGCQGSTGPASPHPDDGRPYGSRFPVVTIRDMVRAPGAV